MQHPALITSPLPHLKAPNPCGRLAGRHPQTEHAWGTGPLGNDAHRNRLVRQHVCGASTSRSVRSHSRVFASFLGLSSATEISRNAAPDRATSGGENAEALARKFGDTWFGRPVASTVNNAWQILDGEGRAIGPGRPPIVEAREDACLNFAPAPHLCGSAKTHSVEPPSGFFISGTSVDNERPSPDPLPVATATYCVPLTL
jgi:hypothetical protein